MANLQRGEVDIEIERMVNDQPVTKTYTLKLSMNAAATLEGKLKKKMAAILDEAISGDFTAIRDIMFVLLQKHHKAEFKTVEQVGDLIDDAGGVAKFFQTLSTLIQVNGSAGEPTGNPPQAQAGTGDASSLRLVESA